MLSGNFPGGVSFVDLNYFPDNACINFLLGKGVANKKLFKLFIVKFLDELYATDKIISLFFNPFQLSIYSNGCQFFGNCYRQLQANN
jgi:hypothetical protein